MSISSAIVRSAAVKSTKADGPPAYAIPGGLLTYVDYRDAFGDRYRSGYARRYVPAAAANNLVFETTEGYNYDRAL